MKIKLSSIIILITTSQVIANDNKTSTEITNSKAHQNVTLEPRQTGYGLIKFEGQSNRIHDINFDDPNPNGLVTFEGQPSNKPFRFQNQHVSNEKDPNKPVDNQRVTRPGFNQDGTGYGFYDPEPNAIFDPSFGNENPNIYNNPSDQSEYGLVFQDDNKLEHTQNQTGSGQKKKRRRRRRKPKQLPGSGYGFGPGGPVRPGQGVPVRSGPPYPAPLPGGQFHRPPRSRPSIAEEALVSITSALTSIARYDDYQCVPRLLCEVAGGQNPVTGAGAGGGAAGGSGVLQSIVNLQPLVTLLAAYNGVSTSPLFVFGRAALLGMTSKGNAGTCRYAYPQCPTDPEKLVEYLNNHNGGFFRFFNNPQPYGEQNLEQFYSQLSGSYGLYQPQSNPNGFPNQNFGGYPVNLGGNPHVNVGGYPNGLAPNKYQQIPGLYSGHQEPGDLGYGYQNVDQLIVHYPNEIGGIVNQNPSSYRQGYGFHNPVPEQNYGLYHGNQNKYGFNYPYQRGKFKMAKKGRGLKNEIEKRIQNRPDIAYVGGGQQLDENGNTKWIFPNSDRNENFNQKQRFQRTVVFPEKEDITPLPIFKDSNVETSYVQQNIDFNRKAKGFNFPENQSNRQYIDYYDFPPYTQAQVLGDNNFKLDEQGFYVESNEDVDFFNQEAKGFTDNEDGTELVYVLRGNGDPNKPEIVKLKPGHKLQ